MMDLRKAPRVWIKNGVDVGVRVIDPVWMARHREETARLAFEAEDQQAWFEVEFRRLTRLQAIPTVPTYWQATETIKSIITLVAKEHDLTAEDILGPSRTKKVCLARQHAIHEVKARRPALSLPQIGRAFGRDHTTILHSLRVWSEKAAKMGRAA